MILYKYPYHIFYFLLLIYSVQQFHVTFFYFFKCIFLKVLQVYFKSKYSVCLINMPYYIPEFPFKEEHLE